MEFGYLVWHVAAFYSDECWMPTKCGVGNGAHEYL